MTVALTKLIEEIKNKLSTCNTYFSENNIKSEAKKYILEDLRNSNSEYIYKYIKEFSGTNLPIRIGLYGDNNMPISFSGLNATVSTTKIYFGGHTTDLKAETIKLTANATNYMYIVQGSTYMESKIQIFTNSQPVSFTKKLVCTAVTNSSSVTSKTFVNFTNYNGN